MLFCVKHILHTVDIKAPNDYIMWLSVLHFNPEIIGHIIIGGLLDNMFMVLVYMRIN